MVGKKLNENQNLSAGPTALTVRSLYDSLNKNSGVIFWPRYANL